MEKTVLITGANKGIGFEIGRQCGKLGFHVILSARNEERLNKSLNDLRDMGINADALVMDVSRVESIKEAASLFKAMDLKLDVLVNNAGIGLQGDKSILTNTPQLMQEILDTNSFGPLHVTREFLPFIKRPGRIIMISSSGGVLNGPVPGWSPAYCVSKTLLNAFTKQIAADLESEQIAVNAVCPGWVKTDMGGVGATRPVEKGAETPVWLTSSAPQSLTCKFLRDKREISW